MNLNIQYSTNQLSSTFTFPKKRFLGNQTQAILENQYNGKFHVPALISQHIRFI